MQYIKKKYIYIKYFLQQSYDKTNLYLDSTSCISINLN